MVQRSQPEPVVRSSLGLSALCQRLAGIESHRVLDLGPAIGSNVEFWSRFSEFIHIADLHSCMPRPPENPETRWPDWDRLLSLPEGQYFDVILVWDLLNYFELSLITELVKYLVRFCQPEAVLFSLIFDFKEMPEKITVYRIIDESHLRYQYRGGATLACPRHQTRALAAAMPGFQVANSFRLRNGVIEYLFVYEK